MQAALHDPERGYYGRRIREVGPRGDFSTSASLGGLLGRAVGAWARETLRVTACRDLIELGPGTGSLAREVMRHFPWWRKPRLHLVERSVPLRERQRETLGDRVRWHDDLAAALQACSGKACIYSNEFVDAFPVRRFRKEAGGWSEQHVLPASSLWTPCEKLPDSSIFECPWPPGQIVEVHESHRDWLEKNLVGWRAGRMLTLDYGAELAGLYHRQPDGSLRAYFHHQCFTGGEALARPGHQDLTADVNFTDLARWSENHSNVLSLRTQAEFLAPHVRDSDQDRFLTTSHGAGDAFLVLETGCR